MKLKHKFQSQTIRIDKPLFSDRINELIALGKIKVYTWEEFQAKKKAKLFRLG